MLKGSSFGYHVLPTVSGPPPPSPVAPTRPYSCREYASLLQWKQKAICKFSIAHKSMLWKFFPMTFRLTFSFSFSLSFSLSLVFHIFVVVLFPSSMCECCVFFCAFHETKLLSQVLNSFSADLCARVPHTSLVGLRGKNGEGEGN